MKLAESSSDPPEEDFVGDRDDTNLLMGGKD
jgi:hypothetical protein